MRFRQKILLAMVWLLTLSYGIGGALLIHQSFRLGLEQEREKAVSSYEMTLQTVQLVNSVDIRQDLSSFRTALERMDGMADQIGVLLTRNGETLYSSGDAPMPDLAAESSTIVLTEQAGRHVLRLSGLVDTNDAPLQLDIAYDVSRIYDARSAQITTYHRILLLLLLIGGGASWVTARLLTGSLGKVSGAARRIAAGDLDARARVRTDDEIGLLGADFDRMADQLSENITELRQSMERQEQFMGSFAHELKTPMTSIIGYADLLRGQSLDDQEAQEAASYIFSEGRRLEALSLKLLDILMMKHQALTTVKTDMAALISGLVGHLQPVFQENGIVLQCRCEAGVCMTDPDLFSSVLTNLLDNARKAMDGGGNIYVLGDRVETNYRIRVLDNGRGMPETALRHLTDAFYRVDKSRSRAQGGAGLGLTLCSRILELHGGTISFASREGQGTCVSVELPEVRE